VLFSNDQVAAFIGKHFEPCWEMVRPVPIVRIDFGNGTVITRTLHGNIASYVCTADGQVLDIVPGIYDVPGYLDALDQLRILAQTAGAGTAAQRADQLAAYHNRQAAALQRNDAPPRLVDPRLLRLHVPKRAIESPLEGLVARKRADAPAAQPKLDSADDLANWKALAEDTAINEKVRRLHIHEKLARAGAVKPAQVTKWLYKEVLHADLDDPYLGLGSVLFASYPFAREDGMK